jgi:hypothetical protein
MLKALVDEDKEPEEIADFGAGKTETKTHGDCRGGPRALHERHPKGADPLLDRSHGFFCSWRFGNGTR